jgi:DUF4097 and DUF4098 domain-containing protein YvlB
MKRPFVIALLVVALALVCVGIGAVIYFANGFPTNNPFDVRNISSVLEESKTIKVDVEKPITLKVNSAAGDVIVTGGDVDSVQVKAVKTAYDSTQARADEEVKTIKYTVEQSGNAVTLKYELPKSMNFNNNINTVDFIVTVPTETTVTVDTGFGEVSVTDTKGDAELANDFGDVTAQNIEGGLSVQTNSGTVEAISIKAGSKDIELRSDFGNITLEKASAADITFQSNSGKVTLKDVNATGDFSSKSDFGDTKYENGSAATITIESNSGKVELVKVKVSKLIKVDDDFGDIELTQATAASYDLHTNSGTITVDGAKGKLKAYTDFGNIEVTNAQSVTLDLKTNSGSVEFSGSLGEEPHLVKSDFGNITLVLPADSQLNVDLKTDFGNIKSDLPITVTLTESSGNDGDEIAGSINDGGVQLTVQTNSGNININAMK